MTVWTANFAFLSGERPSLGRRASQIGSHLGDKMQLCCVLSIKAAYISVGSVGVRINVMTNLFSVPFQFALNFMAKSAGKFWN